MSELLPPDDMDFTEFEESCHDVRELGFVNTDWHKGTVLRVSKRRFR